MNCCIICIGDELLLGQTIDTNSAWMGKALADIGISVLQKFTISDNANAITSTVDAAFDLCDLVVMTGGLGPTKDDITKYTLAKYFNSGWRTDESVMAHLQEIFAARGRELLETNKMQAELPDNCITLFNETGTAPGMLFKKEQKLLFSMPGVPIEMEHIMRYRVIPYLIENLQLPVLKYRTLTTIGIPESLLSRKLEDFEAKLPINYKLAYLPSFQSIRLRLTAKDVQDANALIELDALFQELITLCGEYFVAESEADPVNIVANMLLQKSISFATAESCTGGMLASKFVSEPGISSVFQGAVVSYANQVKQNILGVSAEILETHGAVSQECALAMAAGVRRQLQCDLGIATTGIAGPAGGTPDKPVGTVYVAVNYLGKTDCKRFKVPGDREKFRQIVCTYAVNMVRQIMQE